MSSMCLLYVHIGYKAHDLSNMPSKGYQHKINKNYCNINIYNKLELEIIFTTEG